MPSDERHWRGASNPMWGCQIDSEKVSPSPRYEEEGKLKIKRIRVGGKQKVSLVAAGMFVFAWSILLIMLCDWIFS